MQKVYNEAAMAHPEVSCPLYRGDSQCHLSEVASVHGYSGGETIVAPGAYDPLSARVVQALGFTAVYTGGYMTGAHTSITEPLLTLTEQVEVAQKVARAVDLPVLTDAGAGYGDPLHVMRCVREFEVAGIAGIHIEDQVYPKRASYHKGLEHIVPMPEFVERMTYALQARRDPDFLIIGRTDAFSAVEGSREELVRRGLTLKELGVDAVMPRGVRAREDLAFFRTAVPGVPLMVIAGADDISVQEYADLGYQIIIYATTPAIVAANALMETYQHLKGYRPAQHQCATCGRSPEACRRADQPARVLRS